MIKAIIFDWHGVLDRVTSAGFIKILHEGTQLSSKKLEEAYFEPDQQRIIGKISQKEFEDEIVDKLKINRSIAHRAVEYVDTSDLDPKVWEILKSLKGKYKLALLTDCSIAKEEYIKKLPNFDLFDVKLFSSDKGMTKDNPDFFLLASKELNEKPEYILHIDDNLTNIETANELGFQTHHFTSAEELESFLKKI